MEKKETSSIHSQEIEQFNKPWYHKKGIEVITDSRFEDWEKWSRRNYNREWYYDHEIDKFDSNWEIDSIISTSIIYIDDRFIFGFYLVWKDSDFDNFLDLF